MAVPPEVTCHMSNHCGIKINFRRLNIQIDLVTSKANQSAGHNVMKQREGRERQQATEACLFVERTSNVTHFANPLFH